MCASCRAAAAEGMQLCGCHPAGEFAAEAARDCRACGAGVPGGRLAGNPSYCAVGAPAYLASKARYSLVRAGGLGDINGRGRNARRYHQQSFDAECRRDHMILRETLRCCAADAGVQVDLVFNDRLRQAAFPAIVHPSPVSWVALLPGWQLRAGGRRAGATCLLVLSAVVSRYVVGAFPCGCANVCCARSLRADLVLVCGGGIFTHHTPTTA